MRTNHRILYGDQLRTEIVVCKNIIGEKQMLELEVMRPGLSVTTVWITKEQLPELINDLQNKLRDLEEAA